MTTPLEILQDAQQHVVGSGQHLHAVHTALQELEAALAQVPPPDPPGPGPDPDPPDPTEWIPMDQPPDTYGHYKVKMRVHGEIIVAYSTWTLYQWANCFPIQERLGWTYPPAAPAAAASPVRWPSLQPDRSQP